MLGFLAALYSGWGEYALVLKDIKKLLLTKLDLQIRGGGHWALGGNLKNIIDFEREIEGGGAVLWSRY